MKRLRRHHQAPSKNLSIGMSRRKIMTISKTSRKYTRLPSVLQSGEAFGLWTVEETTTPFQEYVQCICSCGKRRHVRRYALLSGSSASCGHTRDASIRNVGFENRQHGESGIMASAEYRTWQAMIQRCTNPNAMCYQNYGGRGITVCARWRHSFEAFLEDMGRKPSAKHSIDRIDNDGPYEPANCKWSTRVEQARNSRASRRIVFNGATRSLADIADEFAIPHQRLRERIDAGWSIEDAISLPAGSRAKLPAPAAQQQFTNWHEPGDQHEE